MISESKKWKVIFRHPAAEELSRLPDGMRRRISGKMRFFMSSEDPIRFAKRLKETKYGNFRFRVGDYRIIFDTVDKKKEIHILKVGKRDEVYK